MRSQRYCTNLDRVIGALQRLSDRYSDAIQVLGSIDRSLVEFEDSIKPAVDYVRRQIQAD